MRSFTKCVKRDQRLRTTGRDVYYSVNSDIRYYFYVLQNLVAQIDRYF